MVLLASNLLVRRLAKAASSAGVAVARQQRTDILTAEGSIGGAAQSVGGPFDKEGAIGKQFTEGGSLGGTVQNNLGGQKHAGS